VNARYFLLIVCCSLLVEPARAQRVNVIGHRGASTLTPENTLASFSKAIEMGVDYVELDVRSSYDDSLMIMHDDTIDRTTNGTGPIAGIYYSILRHYSAGLWFGTSFAAERIPTLREVLTLLKQHGMKSAPEIKDKNLTSKIVSLVDSMGMNESVTLASFYLDALVTVKKLDPKIKLLYYVDPVTTQAIDTLAAIGGDIIGSGSGNTQSMIDYAHAKGIQFWPWTIDSTKEMLKYLQMNVDAIISNRPQVLIPLRDSLLALSVEPPSPALPEKITLGAYPNPFNPSTTIQFGIKNSEFLTLTVYDLLGREVAVLVNGIVRSGEQSIPWDASGRPAGMYIIRLITPGQTASLKCLFLK
jgi:glycerophosphoryl diester phosphodiesterase